MIANKMPILTINHKTEYRYAHPVAFGEHRIMLLPLPGHDLHILAQWSIEPRPMSLRWIHDVFGNSVAIANFDERAETLTFTSTVTVQHDPAAFELTPDDPAYFYPFLYDDEEYPDLTQFVTPQYGDPHGELSAWARQFLDPDSPTPTFKISQRDDPRHPPDVFTYRKRHEHGTQHPLDTLQLKSGTCRDYALFMIEALRRLGIAARFVSGYLFVPGDSAHGYVGGGYTHAWVQVYLPSAGWVEFDPTNGIVGNRDLVRVAVARDPRQAIPLHGFYLGSADAFLGMDVNINVVSVGDETRRPSRCGNLLNQGAT